MYGKRLKLLRKEKRMTLDDLSSKIGISRSTYAGYEQQHRKPPIEILKRLAVCHNVSIDYILGLTDERDPKEVEYNVEKYLNKENLNWNGIPLTESELKPIKDLLELIVRDRLPHKNDDPDINTNTDNDNDINNNSDNEIEVSEDDFFKLCHA